MKRNSITLIIVLLALLFSGAAWSDTLPETPIGFGRNATGACADANCICLVTSRSDSGPGTFRECAERATPAWIKFTVRGDIELTSQVRVRSNKTIDGRGVGPVTLVGRQDVHGSNLHMLRVLDASNIIVTDIYFRMALTPKCQAALNGAPSDILGCGTGGVYITGESRNIWINRSSFTNCGDKCIVVWDSNTLDADGRLKVGDLISISNSKFSTTFYAILVGVSGGTPPAQFPRYQRVSVYGNWFHEVRRRSPRAASKAQVHAFNNFVEMWGIKVCDGADHGSSSVGEAQLLLENNVYRARNPLTCKAAIHIADKESSGLKPGYVRQTGGSFLNGALPKDNAPGLVFNPRGSDHAFAYPYTLLWRAAVQSAARKAGPMP